VVRLRAVLSEPAGQAAGGDVLRRRRPQAANQAAGVSYVSAVDWDLEFGAAGCTPPRLGSAPASRVAKAVAVS
jgi:hypothetical protein